jgi:hypothetical protein
LIQKSSEKKVEIKADVKKAPEAPKAPSVAVPAKKDDK